MDHASKRTAFISVAAAAFLCVLLIPMVHRSALLETPAPRLVE